jgi:hypothetical protein
VPHRVLPGLEPSGRWSDHAEEDEEPAPDKPKKPKTKKPVDKLAGLLEGLSM